jgi:hypothetical protein
MDMLQFGSLELGGIAEADSGLKAHIRRYPRDTAKMSAILEMNWVQACQPPRCQGMSHYCREVAVRDG